MPFKPLRMHDRVPYFFFICSVSVCVFVFCCFFPLLIFFAVDFRLNWEVRQVNFNCMFDLERPVSAGKSVDFEMSIGVQLSCVFCAYACHALTCAKRTIFRLTNSTWSRTVRVSAMLLT